MSNAVLCATCATEFPAGQPAPQVCPICNDDRQYIPQEGQRWTSFDELAATHTVTIAPVTAGLYALQVSPAFAIDQRTFLVCSPGGNILWDCIPLIDAAAMEFVRSLGGLKAIAISHPHYYSVMRRWAEAFECPILIHELEKPWVFNGGGHVEYWTGDRQPLWDGLEIVRTGGHFPGSSVLRVPALSPAGALLTGDTIYLSRSLRHLSMMYSYPNHIPLPAEELQAAVQTVEGLTFDTLYGAFSWQNLEGNARQVFEESVKRYQLAGMLS
jgi:glyoxylase-like metal-dependent hydrolase (beta-lactamase superfamily II)